MVTTRPPKTIVKPTALGPVANTDTKLLIYGPFQKGRVLAQDAVAGVRTTHGGALLASDMHLGHAVPNIWYRAVLNTAVGVTLPGTPFLVAGSNTKVASGSRVRH